MKGQGVRVWSGRRAADRELCTRSLRPTRSDNKFGCRIAAIAAAAAAAAGAVRPSRTRPAPLQGMTSAATATTRGHGMACRGAGHGVACADRACVGGARHAPARGSMERAAAPAHVPGGERAGFSAPAGTADVETYTYTKSRTWACAARPPGAVSGLLAGELGAECPSTKRRLQYHGSRSSNLSQPQQYTRMHTYTHAHTRVHAGTHTRARTHARAHARADTRTHAGYTSLAHADSDDVGAARFRSPTPGRIGTPGPVARNLNIRVHEFKSPYLFPSKDIKGPSRSRPRRARALAAPGSTRSRPGRRGRRPSVPSPMPATRRPRPPGGARAPLRVLVRRLGRPGRARHPAGTPGPAH